MRIVESCITVNFNNLNHHSEQPFCHCRFLGNKVSLNHLHPVFQVVCCVLASQPSFASTTLKKPSGWRAWYLREGLSPAGTTTDYVQVLCHHARSYNSIHCIVVQYFHFKSAVVVLNVTPGFYFSKNIKHNIIKTVFLFILEVQLSKRTRLLKPADVREGTVIYVTGDC